jgi:serine protease AprX
MTWSIGPLRRIRWISAVAASSLGLLALTFAMAISRGQLSLPSLSLSSPAAASAGSRAPLDPRIAALVHTAPNRSIQAIVQFEANVGAAQARADVRRAGGRVFGQLHIIPALAVELTAARARWLSRSPDVHAVSLNAVIKSSLLGGSVSAANLQTTYDQSLDVPPLWNGGFTGQGVGVAVIDTGVAGDLPDFSDGSGGSRVVETAVTNPAATTAYDTFGHGTVVAGIIAGNGPGGQYMGVAPGANLISIKASDETGTATVLNVIYALQFAVDHQADYNIRVINMSLDEDTAQSYLTDPLDAAAESAWMHGIVVVVAAGNRGSAPDAVQYAPANDPYVITVGGVDENGTPSTGDDFLASWSSRGTTQDGFQKPDITAPGGHIVSTLAPNSAFAGMCPSCVVAGSYIKVSGTSMAAPMISGLVADILQRTPNWTPDQVKQALVGKGSLSNPALKEVDANKVPKGAPPPPANQHLTPNNLILDPQGDIDYTRSSWSRSTWSTATGTQSATFARSSWSCMCSDASTDPTSLSRSSWSRSSWSLSSWSTVEPLADNPGVERTKHNRAAMAIMRAARFAKRHPHH